MQRHDSPAAGHTTSQVTPLVSPPVTLAVREYGDRSSHTHVLLLHGYPDSQAMWEPAVAAMPGDWHVITYDSRGTGASSRPADRASYVLAMLVEDLIAVVDATVPAGERVHLVGHDWGSTLGWDAVAAATWDPRLEGRLASFTSASGPPLDHLATRARGWRGRLRSLPQALHSWYVGFFLLPWLPELSWRWSQRAMRWLLRRLDPTTELLPWGREVRGNATDAIELYRANVLSRLRHPVPWRTSLPVQVVIARRDAFIVPGSLDGLEARCRDLTRVEVDQGHWFVAAEPVRFARMVRDFVGSHSPRA